MNKNEKAQILVALDVAYHNSLDEQDVHRDRVTAMKDVENGGYLKTLPALKWKGIAKAMADECYPPRHQDRDKYFGREFDQYPRRIQLDQIADKDIRFQTYYLGEVADHCERIKASAKFLEILNANPNDRYARFLFNFWVKHSIVSLLEDEQKEVGNKDQELAMRNIAEETEQLFDIAAKTPEIFEIIFSSGDKSEPD